MAKRQNLKRTNYFYNWKWNRWTY